MTGNLCQRPLFLYLFAGVPFVILLFVITMPSGRFSLLKSRRGDPKCALLEQRVRLLEAQLEQMKELGAAVASSSPVKVEPFCDADTRMFPVTSEQLHFKDDYKGILDANLAGPNEFALKRDPRWWCDKIDRGAAGLRDTTFKKADTSELVVAVLGGNNVAQSRATAARDTWLQRVKHHTIFTIHGDPSVPTVGLFEYYGDEFKGQLDYERDGSGKSPMGEKNWLGARYIYEKNPDKSWYLIANDDMWTNVDELMKELERFPDPKNNAYWLVPELFPYTFNDGDTNFEYLLKVGTEHYADTWKWGNGPEDKKKKFAWTSGGFGTLVSNPAMKAMVGTINKFRAALPDQHFDHGNDVETGACLTFLGFTPTKFETHYGAFSHSADSHDVPWTRSKPGILSAHYAWPFKTLSLEQWTVHRNIEVMAREGRTQDLVDYLVEFADDHYDIMRRKLVDVRYAHEMKRDTNLFTKNWFDIPSLLHPPAGQGTPETEKLCADRLKLLNRDRLDKR